MFAYCENNPINSLDSNGCVATEAAGATALAYFLEYVLPEIILGGLLVISGAILVYLLVKVVVDAIENAGSTTKTETKTKKKDPIVFPVNPYDFNPIGLTRIYYEGTKNGPLISWIDPITNQEVFRWDANINRPNGPHYHIYGSGHYIPGISFVPEPYASIYFPKN